MYKPKISVIMLTYNRESLVNRMIECIITQTFKDFEYIIVDNGSTDRSGVIADEYAARDSRIRVIHRERGNIGSGRNAGLAVARGEYIAFVDDDDWCEPDFLAFLYGLLTKNKADVAICGADDKAFDELIVMSAEDAIVELLRRKLYNVQFPTKLISLRLFGGIWFSESSRYDDIELMPRILADAGCVAYHGLPKYTFYRHDNNNSAWTTNHSLLEAETLDEYLRVYRERTIRLCGQFPCKCGIWRYFKWSFMISMVEKIVRLKLRGYEGLLEDMIRELRGNKEEFFYSEYIQDFEKDWMNQYVDY